MANRLCHDSSFLTDHDTINEHDFIVKNMNLKACVKRVHIELSVIPLHLTIYSREYCVNQSIDNLSQPIWWW